MLLPARIYRSLATSQRHVATTAPRMHIATYHVAKRRREAELRKCVRRTRPYAIQIRYS